MSGSIGGHRINRGDVQPTLDNYIEKVLKPFPGYQDCAITGSYNTGTKKDHGDIDIVVYIDAKDIKALKKEFKAYLEKLPDDITVPFALGKRKGDKAQMFGAIVTCGFPIAGTQDPVQIDNILVTTRSEARFQRSFLNLNAQKQGLLMGLVRVVLQQSDPKQILNHFELNNLPDPGPGQEYEFVLSSAGLSLRLVNLTSDYKEVNRTEVWRSNNWDDVEWLLKDYDLDADYEDMIQTVAKRIKDDRSHRRIYGIMRSMIHVGPGEVGTPKGEAKEAGVRLAKEVLNITEGMKPLIAYMKTGSSTNESLVSTMTIGPIIAFIIGVGTFGEFNDFRGTYNIMDIIRQWWSDNRASDVIRDLMEDPDIDRLKSQPKYMQNKQLFGILKEKLAQPTLNLLARLAGNKIKAEI